MSQMTADGRILNCLVCGRNFHQKGYAGVMEWVGHICQPMTMMNDVTMGPNRFEPFTVVTPLGETIEYRWASELPANGVVDRNRR